MAEGERVEIILNAQQQQRIGAVAIDGFGLQAPQAVQLDDGVGGVDGDGGEGDGESREQADGGGAAGGISFYYRGWGWGAGDWWVVAGGWFSGFWFLVEWCIWSVLTMRHSETCSFGLIASEAVGCWCGVMGFQGLCTGPMSREGWLVRVRDWWRWVKKFWLVATGLVG